MIFTNHIWGYITISPYSYRRDKGHILNQLHQRCQTYLAPWARCIAQGQSKDWIGPRDPPTSLCLHAGSSTCGACPSWSKICTICSAPLHPQPVLDCRTWWYPHSAGSGYMLHMAPTPTGLGSMLGTSWSRHYMQCGSWTGQNGRHMQSMSQPLSAGLVQHMSCGMWVNSDTEAAAGTE